MTARDRIIVLALSLVVVLAGFWFAVLSPKRGEATKLDADIVTQRERLRVAQATAAQASEARARHEADYAAVAKLGKAVPVDDDLPSLLFQLETAARGAKIDFRSIKRAQGDAAGAAAPAQGGAAATASEQPGQSDAPVTAGAASSSAPATGGLPPGATAGTGGLATLPFSFGFRGSYFQLERFLRDVQRFVVTRDGDVSVRGRLLTIDGVSFVPGSKDPSRIEANVSATAYLQPAGSDPAGDTATAPGASGSPDPRTPAAPSQTASATPSGAQ